ncbi:LPS-assembly lipoprotein LptE [Flavobacterium sp. W21_SRS_FM6]|uniref:LPS-assembly lipoprotein LptE n=1 Tax=Flavobacterium sp. W21_SRS_FM6 TaxID=3240268 RepID=UPI003F8F7C76
MLVTLFKGFIAGGLLIALTGCGFSLRGAFHLPAEIQTVQLSSVAHNASLERALAKRLKPYWLQMVDNSGATADLTITLLPDELDRRLLSLFQTGQVAEYELVYTVKYQLQFAHSEMQAIEFTVTREYQDDPDAVLAKSRELDLVLGEMRQQAADRIIRQISTSYPHRNANSPL